MFNEMIKITGLEKGSIRRTQPFLSWMRVGPLEYILEGGKAHRHMVSVGTLKTFWISQTDLLVPDFKAETRLILNMLSAEIGNNDGFPKGIFDSDLNVKKFPTSGFDLTEINDLKEAIKCMIGLSKYISKFEYYLSK